MANESPASVLVSGGSGSIAGSVVGVVNSSGAFRLQTSSEITGSALNIFDSLAKESTLDSIKDVQTFISATLLSISSSISAIKDDVGIQRISQQLPSGSNQIGAVSQGSPAAAANSWPVTLHSSGTQIVAVQSGSSIRLGVDAFLSSQLPAGINEIGSIRITPTSTTSVSSVTASVTVVTLLALNSSRRGASIHNNSNKDLHIKLGSGASLSSFTVKAPRDFYYEVPFGYTGIITGIWDSGASGNAQVTEVTL